ncbi:MAG: GntR family transcriptional regulator, partial [Bacteroidota bacterium]|nr:GntR family transcriptional regulator [Bacteroidota bacterium]
MQIADYFYENILLEKWKADDKVPSVRQMAIELEVNPNTVMRTYTHLQDKNIIINRRGIGFFVSDKANEIVKDIVKKQFVMAELPLLFKTMEMLKLTIHEVS